jgi:Undecaprenyl-phosphate galactose phosphotransferase WbaP
MSQRKLSSLQTQTEGFSVSETHRGYNYSAPKAHGAEPAATITSPTVISLPVELPARKRQNIADPLKWYVVLDALSLMLGFFTALTIAALLNGHFFNRTLETSQGNEEVLRVIQYLIISCGVLLNFERLGHYRMRKPFWLETQNVFSTLAVALAIDGFLQFAAKQDFSRMSLVMGWGFAAFAILFSRGTFRSIMRRKKRWQISTLLVGSGSTADDARVAIRSERSLGFTITAQISNLPLAYEKCGHSWEQLCAQHKVDYVVIALDGPELARSEEPIAQLMREEVPFSVSPPLRHIPVLGMVPQYFFSHDVMFLTHSKGLERPLPRILKRGFDVLGSGMMLLCFSPLFLMLAALVKLDGGDVFFAHKRIGYGGKPFRCLKFRSMMPNGHIALKNYLEANLEAQEEWETTCKLRDDPRVTRVGKFLRRHSLDELPQLINVLRGEMSLVGPRPISLAEINRYDDDIAYYYRVRPGITGVWQVSGRNTLSYAKRVQMDVWYVRNWSLWHDVAILCKTLPALLNQDGAY